MLQGLFNYDNPVWRFIGKLGDLILLNILWIVCSIPIVTAGAATTAVYYVTLKLVRDENDGTIKNFFHSFKENFVQSTIIWVILLAAGALLAFDFWFFLTGQMNSLTGVPKLLMTAVFGGFLMLYIFISTYVFALQSRFYVRAPSASDHWYHCFGCAYSCGCLFRCVFPASGSHAVNSVWISPDCLYQFLFLYGNLPEIYAKERGA